MKEDLLTPHDVCGFVTGREKDRGGEGFGRSLFLSFFLFSLFLFLLSSIPHVLLIRYFVSQPPLACVFLIQPFLEHHVRVLYGERRASRAREGEMRERERERERETRRESGRAIGE